MMIGRIIKRLPRRAAGLALITAGLLFQEFATASAQKQTEHPIDRTLNACMEKNTSTAGMSECLSKAYEMWDKELNRVYGELARRLDPAARQSLRDAQRQWLLHRDAEFKLIADVYSSFQGTMYIPMQADSRVQVVRKRTLELSDYLELLKEHKQ
ncbi:MAG: DUF1311 domain-containing protein [Acidobacteria bacterium]|nr:DUF1311 domain-containing protein [Acidobacteriota bacterium]